jgi:hypothetical protein
MKSRSSYFHFYHPYCAYRIALTNFQQKPKVIVCINFLLFADQLLGYPLWEQVEKEGEELGSFVVNKGFG